MIKSKFAQAIIPSVIGVIVCFAVGISSRYIQAYSLEFWYPFIEKSIFTPPNFIFPIAWGIIYLLLGISIGVIWISDSIFKRQAIALFVAQLLLNFLWSVTFFYLQSPVLGFANIIILDIAVIAYMRACLRVNLIAFWVNIPYLLWLALATYLNAYIMMWG